MNHGLGPTIEREPIIRYRHSEGTFDKSVEFIAELGDMRRFDNVREGVAYVGLNPQQYQSGKKRATHGISQTGSAKLRAALYMPTIVAKTHNPVLTVFAKRLEDRGLRSKQVIVAVMRKLLRLA